MSIMHKGFSGLWLLPASARRRLIILALIYIVTIVGQMWISRVFFQQQHIGLSSESVSDSNPSFLTKRNFNLHEGSPLDRSFYLLPTGASGSRSDLEEKARNSEEKKFRDVNDSEEYKGKAWIGGPSDSSRHRADGDSNKSEDDAERENARSASLFSSGWSSVSCSAGACDVRNLYLIDRNMHAFIPRHSSKRLMSISPSMMESSLIERSENGDLLVGVPLRSCLEKVRSGSIESCNDIDTWILNVHVLSDKKTLAQWKLRSMIFLEGISGILAVPRDSTLSTVILSYAGAHSTFEQFNISDASLVSDYFPVHSSTSSSHTSGSAQSKSIAGPRIILKGRSSSPRNRGEWMDFMHFVYPAEPVHNVDNMPDTRFDRAVLGLTEPFHFSTSVAEETIWSQSSETGTWMNNLSQLSAEGMSRNALRKLANRVRSVIGHSKRWSQFYNDDRDSRWGLDEVRNDQRSAERSGTTVCYLSRSSEPTASYDMESQLSRKALFFEKVEEEDEAIVSAIQSKFDGAKVHILDFEYDAASLHHQVQLVHDCNILIGISSPRLALAFFMRPNSTLFELIPDYPERYLTAGQKPTDVTYQNLSRLLGIRYISWKSYHCVLCTKHGFGESDENSRKNSSYIEDHQSENSQDFSSFVRAIEFIRSSSEIQYLIFMPWEQLNNQLIAFKGSCAVAKQLGRTLVLPPLSYRKKSSEEWDFSFSIKGMEWKPFEKYFDLHRLVAELPCSVITMDNFISFHSTEPNFNIGQLIFNPVAKATSPEQLTEFYEEVLKLPHEEFALYSACEREYPNGMPRELTRQEARMSQLTDTQLMQRFENEETSRCGSQRVLALGAAFWIYGFDRFQPYPLTEYVNYIDHPTYKNIVGAMEFSERLLYVARRALESHLGLSSECKKNGGCELRSSTERAFPDPEDIQPFLAMHIRRGDYWNKCKHINLPSLRAKCYPSPAAIEALAAKAFGTFSNLRGDVITDEKVENLIDMEQSLHMKEPEAKTGEDGGKIRLEYPKEISEDRVGISALKGLWRPTIYIATNIGISRTEFKELEVRYRVLYFEDLFYLNEDISNHTHDETNPDHNQRRSLAAEIRAVVSAMDPNELAILDMTVATLATMFIGNLYSSFSRTIFERRDYAGIPYWTF